VEQAKSLMPGVPNVQSVMLERQARIVANVFLVNTDILMMKAPVANCAESDNTKINMDKRLVCNVYLENFNNIPDKLRALFVARESFNPTRGPTNVEQYRKVL
jgi:hypothetical protein